MSIFIVYMENLSPSNLLKSPSNLLKSPSFSIEMMEISMKNFNYITNPAKLLTPEIVQMVGSIHEHKGKVIMN